MDLTRNDANRAIINKEQFNLDDEIKSIISLYKETAKSQQKDFCIDLKYNGTITADLNKIKQLLVILLDNALKYTEKNDSIEVKTYKKDGKCFIEVNDTGIGISKKDKKHIFERFYRSEKSRNRENGGMGLGLSIAYGIVKIHKGTIKVEDNDKKGTKMVIRI